MRNISSALIVVLLAVHAHAASLTGVIVNEFLAQPPSAIDVNGDGFPHFGDDEFVEILNLSPVPVEMSGWTLEDSVRVRHTFAGGTLLHPYEALVVFGGWSSALPAPVYPIVMADSGALGLNNTGDTISLIDPGGVAMDTVTYAQATPGISLTRVNGSAEFFLHNSVAASNYSPLTAPDGLGFSAPVPVPSPVLLLGSGLAGLAGYRRRRRN